jgi:hypothetical protein
LELSERVLGHVPLFQDCAYCLFTAPSLMCSGSVGAIKRLPKQAKTRARDVPALHYVRGGRRGAPQVTSQGTLFCCRPASSLADRKACLRRTATFGGGALWMILSAPRGIRAVWHELATISVVQLPENGVVYHTVKLEKALSTSVVTLFLKVFPKRRSGLSPCSFELINLGDQTTSIMGANLCRRSARRRFRAILAKSSCGRKRLLIWRQARGFGTIRRPVCRTDRRR